MTLKLSCSTSDPINLWMTLNGLNIYPKAVMNNHLFVKRQLVRIMQSRFQWKDKI